MFVFSFVCEFFSPAPWEDHSPERMGQMVIINAPGVVYTFFSMISYLLDEVTANKIRLFTSREQWEPVLREIVHPCVPQVHSLYLYARIHR
jgi:hypothetical protein